ncbi:MAG: hypothetical protein ACK4NE_11160, partial [Albidovulum sp.]
TRAQSERRLATIEAEQSRLVDAIAAGLPIEGLRQRAEALAAERQSLREALAQQPELPPSIHPGLIENYRRQVAQLHEIVDGDAQARESGRALIASLIDKIEVSPRQDGRRGADLVIHGQLAALLQSPNDKSPAETGGALCMSTMVAGAGFSRWHTLPIAA